MRCRTVCLLITAAFAALVFCQHTAFGAEATAGPGSLDPSFGQGGIAATPGHAATKINALLVQPDSKSVLVGYAGNDIFVLRFRKDGTLDSDFGSQGVQTINLGQKGYLFVQSVGTAIARQSDDKLLVGAYALSSISGRNQWVVVRLNTDGTLDSSFGGDGIAVIHTNTSDILIDVLVLSDNKILVSGYTSATNLDAGIAVVRLATDGQPDASFGAGGRWETPSDSIVRAQIVAQPDGRILVGGAMHFPSRPSSDFFVIRLTGSGSLDSSFASNGIAWFDLDSGDESIGDMALLSDGRILLAGTGTSSSGQPEAVVVRMNKNGTADQSFGNAGSIRKLISGSSKTYGNSIALQNHGLVVVAGAAHWLSTVPGNFVNSYLWRFNLDGSDDLSFGNKGTIVYDVAETYTATTGWTDEARAVAIQPDTNIIAAGWVDAGATDYGYAMRLLSAVPLLSSQLTHLPLIIR